MSFKFPDNHNQKFKNRICLHCKKNIDIADYLLTNKAIYNMERLIQLWENDKLEFYCCLCYDDLIQNEKLNSLRNSLNDEELDILRIIEKRCKIEIPIVSQINYDTVGVFIYNGKINGLSLFKCLKFFPEEITMLQSLEKLNLAWNYLESLPESIYNLTYLKELDLIGNKLTYIHENINQMSMLTELDLSFNNLKTIPKTIESLTSLKILNLIHNPIRLLPESLKMLEEKGLKILQ